MDSLVNYCSEDDGVKKHADDRIDGATYSSSKRGKIKDEKKSDSSNKPTKQKSKEKHHDYRSVETEKDYKRSQKESFKDRSSDRLKSKNSGRNSGGGDYYRNDRRNGGRRSNKNDRKNDFRDNKRKRDNIRGENDSHRSKNRDGKSRKEQHYENDRHRYKQKKRSESPKGKSSSNSRKNRLKSSDKNDLITPSHSRHNGTNRECKEDTTPKANISATQRTSSTAKTFEDVNKTVSASISLDAQSNQTAVVSSQPNEVTVNTSLPSYYNRNIINPNKYAEQVQKRKLIWGSKKAEDTTGKWDNAKFSQDTDGKVQSKFMRLMGIKTAPKRESNDGTNIETPIVKADETQIEGEQSDIKTRENMFSNMEHQYEVARQVTHTMRGVGLGFGSQTRQF